MGEETPAALLTTSQREYISGEGSPAQERTMRTRIRERFRAALTYDLPLLKLAIDDSEDRGPITDLDAESVIDKIGRKELTYVLREQVVLVHLLAQAGGLKGDVVIQQGLDAAQKTRAEALLQEFHDDPSSMTFHELSFLKEVGKIDEEELMEAFREPPEESRSGITSPGDIDEMEKKFSDALDDE